VISTDVLLAGRVSLKDSLEILVIDEADQVLLYGYGDDVKEIVVSLPPICQTFLMSATLSSDLEELKRTVLHTPAVLKLEEGSSDGHLAQFFIEVEKYDKYLLLYALMKLNLISGKAIFFVNDVERCGRAQPPFSSTTALPSYV
jgi:ATP-dependent RNA helicase DDX56/DBP9